MKKVSFATLGKVMALAIGMITSTTYATDVYLDNAYGAAIKYIIAAPSPSTPEYILSINGRAPIGNINTITNLSIRTTGTGSGYGLSPYYDLGAYLTQIRNEQNQHPNSDAIINISSSYGRWYVTIVWEQGSSSLLGKSMTEGIEETFTEITKEDALMSLNDATARLNAIKEGALGMDYAHKVNAICSADYTIAKSKGFIDLCAHLQSELMAPKYARDPRIKHAAPDLKPAIDEIKAAINRLSRSLNNYRTKGIVQ
jgi:hypothetical protein